MAEFKTLQFPNNAAGQQRKVEVLREQSVHGWQVVSETLEQSHIKGGQACCLTGSGVCCVGPLGAPAGLLAGRTTGTITVTLRRDVEPG